MKPLSLLLTLAALIVPALAADAPTASTSGGITEIVFERTWCYGSCPIDQLVLRADGSASYTGMQNAPRTGAFTGKFWNGDFDQLAKWLVTEGFFDLQDAHGSLNVDTPSHVIRVTRGGERKSVINHSLERSLQVWGMENNIRAVAGDIAWQPAPSGIRGKAAPNASISIYPDKQGYTPSGMKEVFPVRADGTGQFEIPLAAGSYGISVGTSREVSQTVAVAAGRFSEITVQPAAATARDRPTSDARPTPGMSTVPPGSGLYVHALLTPAKYIYYKMPNMYLLGDKWEPTILEKQLWSDSKDNSTFRLGLSVPRDAAVNTVSHYLVLGDAVFEPNGAGGGSQGVSRIIFGIPGEAAAKEVAKYFDTPIRYFQDPGYQLRVTMTPAKTSFKRGEKVTATLRITNTGTNPAELSSRGTRDGRHDYYALTARHNSQPVTNISFKGQRGGSSYPYSILPGASFEDTVDLGEWFEFKEVGTYDIHGAYQLYLKDRKSYFWLPVEWTETVEADLVVNIE